MRGLISPKTPLMIVNELFKDVIIGLQEHQIGASQNVMCYTASFEVRYNFILCSVKYRT